MRMQLTTTEFEQRCTRFCAEFPGMTINQAQEILSDVFYRCNYETALSTRLQSPLLLENSAVVSAFLRILNGRTLLLSTKASAILFHQGAIHVPQAATEEWEIKAFSKRLKKHIETLKHSHALTILSKVLLGVAYSPANFSADRPHPVRLFIEQLQATGHVITPFFVPSFWRNVWSVAEIEQLILSAEKMKAHHEHNIFTALVDATSVTIEGKAGFPAFSSSAFRDGDVIKSVEHGSAGARSECLFVWSPEHSDGTVYDVDFNDLCDAEHISGTTYRVRSATGRVTIQINR